MSGWVDAVIQRTWLVPLFAGGAVVLFIVGFGLHRSGEPPDVAAVQRGAQVVDVSYFSSNPDADIQLSVDVDVPPGGWPTYTLDIVLDPGTRPYDVLFTSSIPDTTHLFDLRRQQLRRRRQPGPVLLRRDQPLDQHRVWLAAGRVRASEGSNFPIGTVYVPPALDKFQSVVTFSDRMDGLDVAQVQANSPSDGCSRTTRSSGPEASGSRRTSASCSRRRWKPDPRTTSCPASSSPLLPLR